MKTFIRPKNIFRKLKKSISLKNEKFNLWHVRIARNNSFASISSTGIAGGNQVDGSPLDSSMSLSDKMTPPFMLTQSNPAAVGFSPQQALRQKTCLASETSFFENFFVIRFVLECLKVHHDILRYSGV